MSNLMKTNKLLTLFLILSISHNLAGQTFEKSFRGCWADTMWDFKFQKNGKFTRISNGHYGNTTVKGRYKVINDTINIISNIENTHGTINEKYIIQEDSILIDLSLGYGYEINREIYPKTFECGLSYPKIIATNLEEVAELEKVLNEALNSEIVRKYYHFKDLPERKLIIANYYKLKANIKIEDKIAVFLPKENIKDSFFIELQDVNISLSYGQISFKVLIHDEGVEINYFLTKEKNNWKWHEPLIIEK